jgi:hypothetical protein
MEEIFLYDKAFFCIDNYYPDPDKIRNDVLSGNGFSWLPEKTSHSYPYGLAPFLGKMTKESYVPDHKIDFTVANCLGKNVVPMMKSDHGYFRLSCETDKPNMFNHSIHSDGIAGDKADWAGVLYLTPIQKEIEGTLFYKNTVLNKSYFTEFSDYDTIQKLGNDNPIQWQKELVSYFVYNRLIIYRADMFHGVGPAFGDSDDTGRLIQLFSWKEL